MASFGADPAARPQRASSPVFWILLSLPIAAWSFIAARQSMSSDTIWMCEAMRRLLSGQALGVGVYEPNPPLDIFTYIVPFFAAQGLHLPLHYVVFAYTMLLVALSAALVHAILRRWDFLEGPDAPAATAAFVVANTILCSVMFGERDQYVALALVPFVLLQAALTLNLPRPARLSWPVFAVGAVFILLKPHHGLIPALMIAHRAIRNKRLPLRDPDFICLAVATTAYLAGTLFLFPAYVHEVLPDVMQLYMPLRPPYALRKTLYWVAAGLFALLASTAVEMPRARKNTILLLEAAAIASIIPYYVQGRTFFYHLFPAFSFMACALGLLLPWLLRREMHVRHTLFAATALLTGFAWIAVPPVLATPRHTQYRNLSIPHAVDQACGTRPGCTFFIFNKNMGIVQETAYYTGHKNASRFPSYWFVPWLVIQQDRIDRHLPAAMTAAAIDAQRRRFGRMTGEDIARGQPAILLIGHFNILAGKPFDFVRYFSAAPAFRDAMAAYRPDGQLVVKMGDYFPGTLEGKGTTTFDIYRRNKGAP